MPLKIPFYIISACVFLQISCKDCGQSECTATSHLHSGPCGHYMLLPHILNDLGQLSVASSHSRAFPIVPTNLYLNVKVTNNF